ncbi:cytochrome P450 [Cristinia sonorae]|uniref:Cytochrome P450 n=1 Tax=Cristinia sonorae TaxID=1940300 RepID=A0A8K0USQ2_9AGAR|nr:cytochrome P450 [Cristinia sonorae]
MSSIKDLVQAQVTEHPVLATVLLASALLATEYASSRSDSRSPPWVPYWFPWVGSAVSLGRDPDAFFKNAEAKFGPVFRVKAAGKNMTYVTSPALISAIYRDTRTFEFITIRKTISEEVFSTPKHVAMSSELSEIYFPAHHRILAPTNIGPILHRYAGHISQQLSTKISETEGASTPLIDLVIMPAYVAAAKAFFGERFPATRSYPPFFKFNDAFHLLVANLPRFITAGPREAWSQGVIQLFESYIRDVREAGEYTELINATLSIGDSLGWTDHALATMLGSDLWAMEANAIWAVYWFIVLLLQHPEDLRRVNAEIDSARDKWTSAHSNSPFNASSLPQFIADSADQFPLITSGILETLRLRTSSFSIRRVTTPTEFGGYKFDVDDQLICNTRIIHMDEEIHERPYDFVLDRYVDGGKKYTKNGSPVPNHTLPFGGGVSICEGRHFAQAEIKTFIVTLLSLATIEVDTRNERWPTPAMERVGVGLISPKGDVNVIVRRRN